MDIPSKMLMHPANSSRPVDARWLRIVDLNQSRKPARHKHDDEWIRDGLQHLRKWEKCEAASQFEKLTVAMPHLDAAHRLRFGEDRLARARLEALLLSGRTIEEVATPCGLSAEAVGAYEAIHFQVLGRLDAIAFVCPEAIGAHVACSSFHEVESDTLLRLIGYRGGADFAEAAYRYFREGIRLPDQVDGASEEELEELVIRLEVFAFVQAKMLPHPLCRIALRVLELVRSLERYIAHRGNVAPPAVLAGVGHDLGLDEPNPCQSNSTAQENPPCWWTALKSLLKAA